MGIKVKGKNYEGASSTMESTIITELFQKLFDKNQFLITKYIADADANTFTRL